MLGDGGLGQPEMLGQLDDSVFAEQQVLKDDQTGAIAETVEQACCGGQGGIRPWIDIVNCHRHMAMIWAGGADGQGLKLDGQLVDSSTRAELRRASGRPGADGRVGDSMATGQVEVTTERASDWPFFDGLDVAAVEVVSVSLNASGGRAPVANPTAAVEALRACQPRLFVAPCEWTLVVATPPATGLSRLGIYLAGRDRCWGRMESLGQVLPAGPRSEVEVESAPGRYVGQISLEVSELPQALVVTRSQIAVCVATNEPELLRGVVAAVGHAQTSGDALRAAVVAVSAHLAVARYYAVFGDQSTVDLFVTDSATVL